MKILPVSMELAKEQNSSFFIELYNIHLKTGTIRICNCDVVINFAGYEFYPVPIERGNIKTSVDAKIDNVDLKIADADNSKIAALMQGFDFRGRVVEIYRIQYPESLEDENIVIPVFYGRLDAPSYSNGEFTCTVTSAFPKNKVPNRLTQYFCNNTFGDELCKMNKGELKINIDVANSTPTYIALTSNALADGKYDNGLLTMGYETKLIKKSTPNSLVLAYPLLSDIANTATITLNCNKTPEMCAKYNNRKNYGGFLAIPKEFRVIT